MDMEFAQLMNDGKVIKLRDLNAAFTDPRKIGIAYFQGSVVVDHMVETYGQAGVNKLLRAYGQGLDTDAALKSALDTDFDQMQTGFDQMLERRFGRSGARSRGPRRRGAGEEAARGAEDAGRRSSRGSYRVQMALGRALRKAGDADGAVRAFEAARRWCRLSPAPPRQLAQIALEKKDRTARDRRAAGVVATDFDNVEAAARAWRPRCARPASTIPPGSAP